MTPPTETPIDASRDDTSETSEPAAGEAHTPWLTGIVPPICTPLDADLEVDVRSLERLIEWQIEAGVAGLFMLGSSSEVNFLTDRQRDVVVEVAVGVAAGSVPVLAGVIDMATSRVVEQARRAADLGADAIVATAPFYLGPAQVNELLRHFRAVKEAGGIDLVAYNIPVAVQTTLTSAVLVQLAEEGVIQAVKDSSGDLSTLRQTLVAVADIQRFSVFTGSELLVDVTLFSGADGAVPGLANVDPHGFVELYETCRKGDWEAARRQQERLIGLFALTTCGWSEQRSRSASAFGGFKAALALRGIIDTNQVGLPQAPLDPDEVASVRKVLVGCGLL
jgi:4-hydroxy-tetrahydrodipicolinate synthase